VEKNFFCVAVHPPRWSSTAHSFFTLGSRSLTRLPFRTLYHDAIVLTTGRGRGDGGGGGERAWVAGLPRLQVARKNTGKYSHEPSLQAGWRGRAAGKVGGDSPFWGHRTRRPIQMQIWQPRDRRRKVSQLKWRGPRIGVGRKALGRGGAVFARVLQLLQNVKTPRGKQCFKGGHRKPQAAKSCCASGVKRYSTKASAHARVFSRTGAGLRSMFLSTTATGVSTCGSGSDNVCTSITSVR